jgi:hypothetical protein
LAAGPGADLDSIADRLRRIELALTKGLRISVPVVLKDLPLWPKLWQTIAAQIAAQIDPPDAPMGSGTLGMWQSFLRQGAPYPSGEPVFSLANLTMMEECPPASLKS